MAPRNLLNLRLQTSSTAAEFDDLNLEAAPADKPSYRPQRRKKRSYDLTRIPKLLMLGYASSGTQRRYERQRDWKRMYAVLMFKIENITIVSGLLLASSCNLLIVGDLRRMTHASVSASIFGSILSIVFGLLCRINITPARLEFLVTRTRLFYYLYSTPSLWGGAAALVFFVAVCAFTWLEENTAKYGWEAKVAAVLMSGLLIANAVACFVLGAGVVEMQAEGDGERLEEEQERKEEREKNENEIDELDQRNRRPRMDTGESALGGLVHSTFGISIWGTDRQRTSSGDRVSIPSREPTRAATVDSAGVPIPPRRVHLRRQSRW
ncbi:hypothetical protein ACEPAF_1033 [Sanghuangporus sanghuang]